MRFTKLDLIIKTVVVIPPVYQANHQSQHTQLAILYMDNLK